MNLYIYLTTTHVVFLFTLLLWHFYRFLCKSLQIEDQGPYEGGCHRQVCQEDVTTRRLRKRRQSSAEFKSVLS